MGSNLTLLAHEECMDPFGFWIISFCWCGTAGSLFSHEGESYLTWLTCYQLFDQVSASLVIYWVERSISIQEVGCHLRVQFLSFELRGAAASGRSNVTCGFVSHCFPPVPSHRMARFSSLQRLLRLVTSMSWRCPLGMHDMAGLCTEWNADVLSVTASKNWVDLLDPHSRKEWVSEFFFVGFGKAWEDGKSLLKRLWVQGQPHMHSWQASCPAVSDFNRSDGLPVLPSHVPHDQPFNTWGGHALLSRSDICHVGRRAGEG